MTEETIEYIWRNYVDLIEKEFEVRTYMGAVKAFGSENPHTSGFFTQRELELMELGEEAVSKKHEDLTVARRAEIAEHVLNKYKNVIYLNYCPACHKLPKTPKSELCLNCGHTWFGKNPHRNEKNI